MKLLKSLTSYNGIPILFTIFYAVGLTLFYLPFTQELFIDITPYTLILVSIAVFYYHKGWNRNTIWTFIGIFILSILVENIGVETGQVFGIYKYGSGLGIKLGHVPILIGLNWILLVYCSHSIMTKFSSNKALKIIGASALMVAYDVFLEIAAPVMDMWEFVPKSPPIENYVVWFLMAAIFHLGIAMFKVNTENKPARALFTIQLIFFLIIAAVI